MVRIHSQGLVSFCTGLDFEFAMSIVSACEWQWWFPRNEARHHELVALREYFERDNDESESP